MDTVESVSWEEPVLGVYGGNNENAPRVGSEPTNSRSLGGHLIHYTTAIVYTDAYCIFMPPFEEEGVYCFAHVGRSVGPSTRWLSDDNSRTLGPRVMKLQRYIDHDSQMTPIDFGVTR
ncbi:hypothetical protein DPMN_124601 [Dreissena polymorpha]|uniref:Uncharacterized protein n=1 Tax=Dreissena polymorpha TaxID=45954 RepID=A0A9D4GWC4_DREPO|nr:hypothetical protein DPMN_124601 [Dreissena polymorpha]